MSNVKRGFTLIELMVVFTVIASIAGIGIASFTTYNEIQKVNRAFDEVTTALFLAKSRAQSQVKPTNCTTTLDGYRFEIVDSGTYQFAVICNGAPIDQQTRTLPDNILFTYGVPSKFSFRVFTGGVEGALVAGTQVRLTGFSSISRIFTVFANGRIVPEPPGATIIPTTTASPPTATSAPTATPAPTQAASPLGYTYNGGSYLVIAGATDVNNPQTGSKSCPYQTAEDTAIHFYSGNWEFFLYNCKNPPGSAPDYDYTGGSYFEYPNAGADNPQMNPPSKNCPSGTSPEQVAPCSNCTFSICKNLTPVPTRTPAPIQTPIPCEVTTSLPAYNLVLGGSTQTVSASVTSGQQGVAISKIRFGSYNTYIATVSPTTDTTFSYSTTVTARLAGNTAVWATADLSDGRTCESTGTTDTDINVAAPTPTPTATPLPTATPTPTPTPMPTPTSTPTPIYDLYTDSFTVPSPAPPFFPGTSITFSVRAGDTSIYNVPDSYIKFCLDDPNLNCTGGTVVSEQLVPGFGGSFSNFVTANWTATTVGSHNMTACVDARGQLNEGFNEGNNCSTIPFAVSAAKRVFVTSNIYSGNLGGLSGADDICRTLAQAQGLTQFDWNVWLSTDDTQNPLSRFSNTAEYRNTTAFRLINGTTVAANWSKLIGTSTAPLLSPINIDENSSTVPSSNVWTNTLSDGTSSDNRDHCNNWADNTITNGVTIGKTAASSLQWTDGGLTGCNNSIGARLYCFEQAEPFQTPAPTPVPVTSLRAFITSGNYTPGVDFTSLDGAKTICQNIANTKGFGGTWNAWLSDSTGSPSTRFSARAQGTLSFVRIDGLLIAPNWSLLISGNLANPIDLDENRVPHPNLGPWTNTRRDGTAAGTSPGTSCDSWRQNNPSYRARSGDNTKLDSRWTDDTSNFCNGSRPIYCFEQ